MTTNTPEFTVSELAQSLKRTVEDTYGHVRVRGELGRTTIAKSGHCYLDIKDDRAVINSIIWKGVMSRLSMRPEEGMEVICEGKLSTYPGRSNYQLIIDKMELAGAGALMALFEKRKKMLAAEGLFAPERKRELPFLPKTIGVVTSPTGSVIRDILHRITDRFPSHVLVWPVLVQGDKAAEQIAGAINGFNEAGGFPRPDVLIVARGGGSMEDLWCFNEEVVARAAANSKIPLISAVGHETDWTLIDFVADYRAPTPTGAAEVAVPVRADWVETVEDYGLRLLRALRRTTSERATTLRAARLPRIDAVLAPARQRLDSSRASLPPISRLLDPKKNVLARHGQALQSAMRFTKQRQLTTLSRQSETLSRHGRTAKTALQRKLTNEARRLDRAEKLLDAYSYKGTLDRGFALVRDEKGNVVRSKSAAKAGQDVSLIFADGEIGAVIAGKSVPKRPRKSATPKTDKKQADLF
ncbi:MAG: exodeoxyribonuclease VII large subunit [Litorimonas sp.]